MNNFYFENSRKYIHFYEKEDQFYEIYRNDKGRAFGSQICA